MGVCSLLLRARFQQDSCLTYADTLECLFLPADDKRWKQILMLKVFQKMHSEVKPVQSTMADQPETIWRTNAEPSLGTVDGILSDSVLELFLHPVSNVPCTQQPRNPWFCASKFSWPVMMPQSVQRSLHNVWRPHSSETFNISGILQSIPNMSSKQSENEKQTFGCIHNCHDLQVLLCLWVWGCPSSGQTNSFAPKQLFRISACPKVQTSPQGSPTVACGAM